MGRLLARASTAHLGPAHDRFEAEADRVAVAVVRRLETGVAGGSTSPTGGVAPPAGAIQRAPAPSPSSTAGDLGGRVSSARGGGRAMTGPLRGAMEGAFGHSFAGVRLHTGPSADRVTRSVGARAMTTGRDVFFRRGEFAPETRPGRLLLAHELTHVLQQRGNPAGYVQRKIGFEFQSVGATHNVKVSQVIPLKAKKATGLKKKETEELPRYRYMGRSSEEVLVPSVRVDAGRWISDSGDLELVTKAVEESHDGRKLMMAQARNARVSLSTLAGKAKRVQLVGTPIKGGSPGKARKKLKRSKFASILSVLEKDSPKVESTRETKEWCTILKPKKGKKRHIAIRWQSWKDKTDDISYVPQMTIGTTLENLGRLIDLQLHARTDTENPFHGAIGYGGTFEKRMITQLGIIDEWLKKRSDQLETDLSGLAGILKVIGAIVVRARAKRDANNQADYVKDLAPWMHRTSLGDAYQLLSEIEKRAFDDFRKDKVLERVGTWKESHKTWTMPHLGKKKSRQRARDQNTDRLLDTVMAGRDPFNTIEDVGIGELTDTHAPSLEKFHVDRSTDIGDGPEGKRRKGMLVEIRKLNAGGVTTAGLEAYVDRVMRAILDDSWRSKDVERKRPELKRKSPPTVSSTSTETPLLSRMPRTPVKMPKAPMPKAPMPKAPMPKAPMPKAPMPKAPMPKAPMPKTFDKKSLPPIPSKLPTVDPKSLSSRKKAPLPTLKSLMGTPEPMSKTLETRQPRKLLVDRVRLTGRPRWFVPLPVTVPRTRRKPPTKKTKLDPMVVDTGLTSPSTESKTTGSKTTGSKTTEVKVVDSKSSGTKLTAPRPSPPPRVERREHGAVGRMRAVVDEYWDLLTQAPGMDEPGHTQWMTNFEVAFEAAARQVWRGTDRVGQVAIASAWRRGRLGTVHLDTVLGVRL